jgi:hypothetical protein
MKTPLRQNKSPPVRGGLWMYFLKLPRATKVRVACAMFGLIVWFLEVVTFSTTVQQYECSHA